MRERIPAFAAALLALAVLAPAAHGKAAPLTTVHCGQVVTQSIRVANDLSGCQGSGLVAGASGITIDLNRHTIAGTGPDVFGAGVLDQEHDRVTVRNGVVRDFTYGVYGESTTAGAVDRVSAVDNLVGFGFRESERAIVTDSRASGGQIGADLGFLTMSSRVSRLSTSNLEQGVVLNQLSRGNVVERSTFAGGIIGVQVFESEDNTIDRNRVSGAAFGIRVEGGSSGNRLLRNDIRDSRENGIDAEEVFDMLVRENRVTGSARDGIAIRPVAFDVVIARNAAYDNGQLGINAQGGIVDGGGNRAARNGDPRQCVGVSCRP